MKKLIIVFLVGLAFFKCSGQRYEIWVKPTDHEYKSVRNLGYFNDSTLSLYSNPTFFILSKDFKYKWDEIDEKQSGLSGHYLSNVLNWIKALFSDYYSNGSS